MIVLFIDQNLLSRFLADATDRIAFVHDSEQFNGVLIDTLKELKTDPAVKCRDRLVALNSKAGRKKQPFGKVPGSSRNRESAFQHLT